MLIRFYIDHCISCSIYFFFPQLYIHMRSWPAENLATCHVWGGSNKNCRCHKIVPLKQRNAFSRKHVIQQFHFAWPNSNWLFCRFFFAVPMLEMQTQFLFSTPVKTRGDKRMGQVGQSTQNVRDSVHTKTGWWLTYPSEQWWSSSVGMMTFPIYGKTTFPNHQLENGW